MACPIQMPDNMSCANSYDRVTFLHMASGGLGQVLKRTEVLTVIEVLLWGGRSIAVNLEKMLLVLSAEAG